MSKRFVSGGLAALAFAAAAAPAIAQQPIPRSYPFPPGYQLPTLQGGGYIPLPGQAGQPSGTTMIGGGPSQPGTTVLGPGPSPLPSPSPSVIPIPRPLPNPRTALTPQPTPPRPTPVNTGPSFSPCINYSYLPAVMGPGCSGPTGTRVQVQMRQNLGAAPAILRFKAVVSRGVPAQMLVRLSGSGSNYSTTIPVQLCMQGGGSWEADLILSNGRNVGVIGGWTPTNCPR